MTEVAQSIIDELPELYEDLSHAEADGSSWYDYVLGCIESRLTILGRMGISDDLIPKDPNNY